ncbi:glutamate synthase [NADPH] small chain [bacterium BMS3Abin01]|nr:glutamate synthase [NADPH] small chain [bacterium BMS3Abin01]
MPVVLKTRKRAIGAAAYSRGGDESHLRPRYAEKTPPCKVACPSENDVRGFMTAISQTEFFGRSNDESYEMAWRTYTNTNPLPAVLGRVCPHFCETGCNRGQKDEALNINQVERFIGDYGIDKGLKHEKVGDESHSEKVAIIGSGPAGLSCAFQLARQGYPVTIFEAAPKSGGMLRYGIPSYRLPEDILDAEVAKIEDLGVEIKFETKVGKDISFDELKQEFDAIHIAIGAQEGWNLGIPGEEGEGVVNAVEYLHGVNSGDSLDVSGKKVLVIGGGNSAIDAARVAWRQGAESRIVYRRTEEEMPAEQEEIDDTREEGIPIDILTAPVEVIRDGDGNIKALKCQKMELGEPDDSGRRRPVPIEGSEFEVEADIIIPAIGQQVDFEGLHQFKDEESGWITVDEETMKAVEEGTFAAGDVTNKLGTVTEAVGTGRKAAVAIDCHIKGEEVPKEYLPPIVKLDDMAHGHFETAARVPKKHISVDQRQGNFNEVVTTYSEEQVTEEADRCMSCGMCFSCDNCYMFCSYSAIKKMPKDDIPTVGDRYVFRLEACVGCKKCAEACPCGYIDMV